MEISIVILLAVLAGATYLYGFRREINAMTKAGQWRNLMLLRFPVK